MTRFYDKYVLVTGGAGFIGSNFLEYFVRKYPNYHFTCIDKLNYASQCSTASLSVLKGYPNFTFIKLDLSESFSELRQLLVEDFPINQITDIVNFAAESSVDKSFSDPLYFTRNNILVTQNLLECMRLLKQQNLQILVRLLHISTDEVYGDSDILNDEQGRLLPTNPYAATKASIDLIIHSYQCSYDLLVTIIRPNNIYGPHQYPDKIVPVTIERLTKGIKIPIHGIGSNKRRYLHVQDFLDALELIWQNDESINEIYNVGSDEEISNLSLVKLICHLYDRKLTKEQINDKVQFIPDRNYNDMKYSTTCGKIKLLGWKPRIKLVDGLSSLLVE